MVVHYTLQMVEYSHTWLGTLHAKQLWCENFSSYMQAMVRSQEIDAMGYPWVLHDWGTDPGPEPEPLVPGEDNGDPDAWEYARLTRSVEKLNKKNGPAPF